MKNLRTKLSYTFYTLLCVAFISCNYTNTQTVKNAKIIDKERVTKSNGDAGVDSFYLIYTDKGEFTIKDELLRGNFKSSTWYGKIEKGNCYNLVVGGYRQGFLSMYQNIHETPVLVSCE
ncbi:hypothetical protein G1K75_09525 [Tenacibaculum finnmarkense]|uniref:hypothetical protein n=1 Tax=Tenacibaculum finnmarkense TaxID=2781243 RepID=UPI001EFB68E5|nr:hypothetical protein [Tenacibaculum finnmarkense]MCG8805895.1 hypothetical protein [Tenacibaculum finnmarkense]MCG8838597.1 hypothetical protein [Tenacibaculum dicentrarchi]